MFITCRIPSRRSLCAAGALLCFAAAFVLTPSDVRSQSAALPEATALSARTPPEPPLHPIAPRRDAFEPRVSVDDGLAATALVPSMLPSPPPRFHASPLGADAGLRITAIATGERPTAIADDAGTTRTLSIGDTIAGATVTGIGTDRVTLSDGRSIVLVTDR